MIRPTGRWLLVITIAMTLWACDRGPSAKSEGGSSEGGRKSYSIALIPKSMDHEFWKAVHAGGRKAALEFRERGIDVEIVWKGADTEANTAQQINIVNTMILRGVNGIVLAPSDKKSLVEVVHKAIDRGIPVIAFDSGIDSNRPLTYVATDNFKGGYLAGRHMGELLGGKGRVIMLRHQQNSESTEQREDGFMKAISEFPGIEVASDEQYAEGKPTQTSDLLLNRFMKPDGSGLTIDGIFCSCEPDAVGMLTNLEKKGLAGKVRFIGFDTSERLAGALRDRKFDGLLIQDPVNMGYQGIKLMVEHLEDPSVKYEPYIDTGVALITPDNMNEPRNHDLLFPPYDGWQE